MPETAERWTAEMVRALPDDGKRYEVVDGVLLVTPSPTRLHQRAVQSLQAGLRPYVQAAGLGEVLAAPADITFGGEPLVQPDVFVVPPGPDGRLGHTWSEISTLLLVIEVLSPSTARADRQVKRRLYQRHNVADYWMVDLDARVIERWRPGDERPEILADRLSWQPAASVPPFELDLIGLFGEVLDR